MCEEMKKLREWLTENRIEYIDCSDDMITRTHFYIKRVRWSVVNGPYTYGGTKGALELMRGKKEPIGWLTADDVIKRIKEVLNR